MDQTVETRQRKAADRLTRKLLSLGPLPAAEMDAVGRLPVQVRSFSANATFVQEGDDPAQSCLVLEGFVFRYKLVRSGARQISAIHIPGDMPDLQSLHLRRMDHSLGALTAAEVAFIPHASIIEMVRAFPAVGLAPQVVIDQHFAERGRIGRLMGAVAQNPRMLGLGVDEDTAFVLEDRTLTVIGRGAIYVVDGADISHSNIAEGDDAGVLSVYDLRLHVLSAGDRFDLASRRPALGKAKPD